MKFNKVSKAEHLGRHHSKSDVKHLGGKLSQKQLMKKKQSQPRKETEVSSAVEYMLKKL
jgi:hypothetical protein